MPESTDSDLWVTWDDYHHAIERLALLIHESDWKFDRIVCLARGGLRPGDVFSRIFEVPLAILSTSSYRTGNGTEQGELDIAAHITSTAGELAGRVLLMDDLVDSGVTFSQVKTHLATSFPRVTEIRTAVIWYKACSTFRPDFYLDYLPSNPWIHQPFEEYDGVRAHQLAAWMKKGRGLTGLS